MDEIVFQLIDRRKKLGLSQRDLAELCDMPQSTIARIESGSINPKLETVRRMSEVMDLGLFTNEVSTKKRNLLKIDAIKRKQVDKCINIVSKNSDIKKLIIFGSASEGTCNEESDLDLCVDIAAEYDKLALHYTKVEIGKACDYNYDFFVYKRIKGSLRDAIDRTGVIVYERLS